MVVKVDWLFFRISLVCSKDLVTLASAHRWQEPSELLLVVDSLVFDKDFLDFTVGAVDVDLFVESCSVGRLVDIARDNVTVVAVPPLLVRVWREGHTGDIAATGAGAGHSVRFNQDNGGGHDSNNAHNQPKKSKKHTRQTVPVIISSGGSSPKESQRQLFDGSESDAKTVQKSSQMGKVVDKRGKPKDTIHNNVHTQPQQYQKVAPSCVIVGCRFQKQQIPVEANICHATPDQSEDPSRSTNTDKARETNCTENVSPDSRHDKEDSSTSSSVGLFNGTSNEVHG
mmetsp:Transcript_10503/g.21849  ORF Transcript_10503/g.21849 Transcript_10503/m.21849 type:complete len:284 (-) Transcript_10503:1155-2006(-)